MDMWWSFSKEAAPIQHCLSNGGHLVAFTRRRLFTQTDRLRLATRDQAPTSPAHRQEQRERPLELIICRTDLSLDRMSTDDLPDSLSFMYVHVLRGLFYLFIYILI